MVHLSRCAEDKRGGNDVDLAAALQWSLLRRSASGDDLTTMHGTTASSGMSSASSDADVFCMDALVSVATVRKDHFNTPVYATGQSKEDATGQSKEDTAVDARLNAK